MKYFTMLNRLLICLLGFWIGFELGYSNYRPPDKPNCILCDPITGRCIMPQMRLVKTSLPKIDTGEPHAKRDESVRYYLQCSVRIRVGPSSFGSGTICYYDEQTGEAWVISCGHLFAGSKSPSESTRFKAEISVFYKNDDKLQSPQVFSATVICYDNKQDISLMKFRPDWVPQHSFVIAPNDYLINQGDVYESTGCDHGKETAAYTVEVTEGMETGQNLITKDNSPRPGRSGGGLLSEDGYLVAIVWGTSKLDGSGYGFHVPLRRIHNYLGQFKETKWILKAGHESRMIFMIPIYDPITGRHYLPPRGYIPMPKAIQQRP